MTRPELVSMISEHANITKKSADAVLRCLVSTVHSALNSDEGKIRIADLGTFRALDLKPRNGVNPRTGKAMTIPGMRVARFTPAASLRKSVKTKKK